MEIGYSGNEIFHENQPIKKKCHSHIVRSKINGAIHILKEIIHISSFSLDIYTIYCITQNKNDSFSVKNCNKRFYESVESVAIWPY